MLDFKHFLWLLETSSLSVEHNRCVLGKECAAEVNMGQCEIINDSGF